jgi:hypothetical protein
VVRRHATRSEIPWGTAEITSMPLFQPSASSACATASRTSAAGAGMAKQENTSCLSAAITSAGVNSGASTTVRMPGCHSLASMAIARSRSNA